MPRDTDFPRSHRHAITIFLIANEEPEHLVRGRPEFGRTPVIPATEMILQRCGWRVVTWPESGMHRRDFRVSRPQHFGHLMVEAVGLSGAVQRGEEQHCVRIHARATQEVVTVTRWRSQA